MGLSSISDLCRYKRLDYVDSTFITEVAALALEMRQQIARKNVRIAPGGRALEKIDAH